MRSFLQLCVLGVSTAALLGQPLSAAEIATKGRACWVGETTALTVADGTFGMTWQLTGTYVDEISEEESSNYHCVGIGGYIGGKPQPGGWWWCLNRFKDGSTALFKGAPNADGTTISEYVAGTGRHEGVTGVSKGSAIIAVGGAPEGGFAGCRDYEGTKVLK